METGTASEAKSSVKAAYNGKGEPSVEVKVYEGATEDEIRRISLISVKIAKEARSSM